MTREVSAACTRPSGGPVAEEPVVAKETTKPTQEETAAMIKVGHKAPDFSASGYQNGTFVNVKLSDYLGKWVLLCFYPGDFTFV